MENKTSLDTVLELIRELGKQRKIPQFFYNDEISASQMCKVRNEVEKFKKENPGKI